MYNGSAVWWNLASASVGMLAITAVEVTPKGTTIDVSAPRALFSARFPPNVWAIPAHSSTVITQSYVPSPDGKRFYLLAMRDEAQSHPITVVLNWTAVLDK